MPADPHLAGMNFEVPSENCGIFLLRRFSTDSELSTDQIEARMTKLYSEHLSFESLTVCGHTAVKATLQFQNDTDYLLDVASGPVLYALSVQGDTTGHPGADMAGHFFTSFELTK